MEEVKCCVFFFFFLSLTPRLGEHFQTHVPLISGMSGGYGGMDNMGSMGSYGGRDMAPVGRMGGE